MLNAWLNTVIAALWRYPQSRVMVRATNSQNATAVMLTKPLSRREMRIVRLRTMRRDCIGCERTERSTSARSWIVPMKVTSPKYVHEMAPCDRRSASRV